MGYASPLGVYIHPKEWVRPAGNNEPKVTATFADHIAGNRNPGLDIGTGRCNDPLYAMDAGTVSLSGLIGTAQVVRIKHPNGDESGYAHLSSRAVSVGQAVKRGQLIGALGSTGASACHLHLGLKRNGVEIDAWPELEQNQEDDMDPSFSPKPNRTVTVNKGARHRLAPSLSGAIAIASDPGGPLGGSLNLALLGTVVGEAVNGNSIWYAYWRPETKKVYYIHTSTCGPETPWESTGHSDAELIEAAKRASYNAANDVSAMAVATALKYPKP